MSYQPIKVIAYEASADGHVNRVTEFDDTPQSNKLCYRDGLPYMTAVPNGQNTRGPRRVDYNGIFYLFSSNLFELQQGNFPTYNSAIVGAGKPLPDGYPLGAVLWYPAGGYFVRSLVADNTESDLTDTTKWTKITISAADLATGLSGKANTDADNLTATGKANIIALAIPDYTSGIAMTTPSQAEVSYTALHDGYILLSMLTWNNLGTYVKYSDGTNDYDLYSSQSTAASAHGIAMSILVQKGDTIKYRSGFNGYTQMAVFYPLKGAD